MQQHYKAVKRKKLFNKLPLAVKDLLTSIARKIIDIVLKDSIEIN